MEHVFVTRFSIPRTLEAENASFHADHDWLKQRLDLFYRFYVPSVERLGVQAVLLCSTESAGWVSEALADLSWVRIVEQNEWFGGWSGGPHQVLTRLDSDDAVHEDWIPAVEAAPPEAEVICTRRFLRLHEKRGVVYRYRRDNPSPLAAFRGGRNPLVHLHEELPQHYRTFDVDRPYLLQVAHGENLSTRLPKWFRRRATAEELRGFGPVDLGG